MPATGNPLSNPTGTVEMRISPGTETLRTLVTKDVSEPQNVTVTRRISGELYYVSWVCGRGGRPPAGRSLLKLFRSRHFRSCPSPASLFSVGRPRDAYVYVEYTMHCSLKGLKKGEMRTDAESRYSYINVEYLTTMYVPRDRVH